MLYLMASILIQIIQDAPTLHTTAWHSMSISPSNMDGTIAQSIWYWWQAYYQLQNKLSAESDKILSHKFISSLWQQGPEIQDPSIQPLQTMSTPYQNEKITSSGADLLRGNVYETYGIKRLWSSYQNPIRPWRSSSISTWLKNGCCQTEPPTPSTDPRIKQMMAIQETIGWHYSYVAGRNRMGPDHQWSNQSHQVW
jgi:hypothetical protein